MWYMASTIPTMKGDKIHFISSKCNIKSRAIFQQPMNGLNGTTDAAFIDVHQESKSLTTWMKGEKKDPFTRNQIMMLH